MSLLEHWNVRFAQALSHENISVHSDSPRDFSGARSMIISHVRHLIGPELGTNVNLFVVHEDGERLIPSDKPCPAMPDGLSHRVFTKEDETFEKAMAGESRFVESADENLEYETFITAPIAMGSCLYGLLTVDSPKTGDLTEIDTNLMILFAK